jgi:hypothetical protein
VRRSCAEIAWAAGLFEGEGSISYARRGGVPRLTLGSTDFDVVERFLNVIGRGGIRANKIRAGNKPLKTWSAWTAPDCIYVLKLLLPWLGARRRAKALEALEQARKIQAPGSSRTHCPQGHPYAGSNLYLDAHQHRRCRACHRESTAAGRKAA